MKDYAKIYNFYNNAITKLLRFFIFLLLLWLIAQNISNWYFLSSNLKLSISFLSFFLTAEIFFRFKISKVSPFIPVSNNTGNIYQSFTLEASESFIIQGKTEEIAKNLLEKKSIKFILKKAEFSQKEISLINVSKEELGKYAQEIAKNAGGRFVTTMDLFAAYILIIEPTTKLLFSKKLKSAEFLDILSWAKRTFADEESKKPIRINFWGEGIADDWISGWTLETKKYTTDQTREALNKNLVLIDRENERKEMIEILSKSDKNNVLLVGEPSVGVESIVNFLASESFLGNLPKVLNHKRILEFCVGPFLAGASEQGDLQQRLEAVLEELSHSGNIILYIPEVQNIFGGQSFHLDLSASLPPYLKDGKTPVIATITPGNFRIFQTHMQNVMEEFEAVQIEEPSKDLALQMVLEKSRSIEEKNKVSVSYLAVLRACELASKYVQNRYLPGSAIQLLEDAATSASLNGRKVVEEEDVVKKLEEKTKILIGKPKAEEKQLLLHLEEKIHERLIDQENAVFAIAEAMRRLRSGLTEQDKPISFLFLGPTGVGKTETAKTLASLYFGGEGKMIRLDMSEYTGEDGVKRLLGALPGEGEEKGELTEKVWEHPFSLVLLDEFEKANSKILDLFLQVLDDGRLTDNKGKTVSFDNTIIIATSNAGSEFIREEIKKDTKIDKKFQENLLNRLQEKGIFKPELLNRFDDVIVFKSLGEKETIKIAKLILENFSKKMKKQDINVSFSEQLISRIIKDGFNEEFGARPLRRFVQDNIEDLIAQKLLKDEVKRGDKITISVDSNNDIILQ